MVNGIVTYLIDVLCGSVEVVGDMEHLRGRQQVRCLSCSLRGASCQYVSAQFSRSASYYVLGCLGPAIPTYRLLSVIDDTGSVIQFYSIDRQ